MYDCSIISMFLQNWYGMIIQGSKYASIDTINYYEILINAAFRIFNDGGFQFLNTMLTVLDRITLMYERTYKRTENYIYNMNI